MCLRKIVAPDGPMEQWARNNRKMTLSIRVSR